MESNFRIFNILHCIDEESKYLDLLRKEFYFVKSNLELHSNNNHILFNYISMVVLSEYFEPSEKSNWLEKLKIECKQQFYPDGGNFEASSSYHILSLEALLLLVAFDSKLFFILDEINLSGAISIAREFELRNKELFLLGDNDSSTLLNVNGREGQIRSVIKKHKHQCYKKNRVYKDFGLAVSENIGKFKLLLWNPQAGQRGRCGHDHNDNVSILLSYDDFPILVDPGTFCYSLFRDYFRSYKVHNNISTPGLEYEKLLGKFQLGNEFSSIISAKNRSIESEYYNDEFRIKRNVLTFDTCYEIKDVIESFKDVNNIELRFALACQVVVSNVNHNYFLLSINHHNRDVSIKFEFLSDVEISVEKIFLSQEYGKIDTTNLVKVKCNKNDINWKIYEI